MTQSEVKKGDPLEIQNGVVALADQTVISALMSALGNMFSALHPIATAKSGS